MTMTITQAIARLEALKTKHGDIHVQADCPFCGKIFDCELAVVAPEVVRLKEARTSDEIAAMAVR